MRKLFSKFINLQTTSISGRQEGAALSPVFLVNVMPFRRRVVSGVFVVAALVVGGGADSHILLKSDIICACPFDFAE